MTSSPFAGRVYVVAGNGPVFSEVSAALAAKGAEVAVVTTGPSVADVAAHFRADPSDPEVWGRMVPHVEQRLGPIDAVLTDEGARSIAERLVGPDLIRRGHGAVVVVGPDDETDSVLRTLTGMH